MTAFKLKVNAVGRGTCEIDGKEVSSSVMGASIRVGINNPTEIYLELVPGAAEIEGDGIVYVLSGNSVKKFLAGLDLIVVKAEALNSMGWEHGGTDDPIVAAINVIKRMGDEWDANQS